MTIAILNSDNIFTAPIRALKNTWKKLMADIDTQLTDAQATLTGAQAHLDQVLATAAQTGNDEPVAAARQAVIAARDTLTDLQGAKRGAQNLDDEQSRQTAQTVFKEKVANAEKTMTKILKAAKKLDRAVSDLATARDELMLDSGQLFDIIFPLVNSDVINRVYSQAGRARLEGALRQVLAARGKVPGLIPETDCRLVSSVELYAQSGIDEIRAALKEGGPRE